MSNEYAPTPQNKPQNNYFNSGQWQRIEETREQLAKPSPWLVESIKLDSSSKLAFSEPYIITPEELQVKYDTEDLLAKPSPWLK